MRVVAADVLGAELQQVAALAVLAALVPVLALVVLAQVVALARGLEIAVDEELRSRGLGGEAPGEEQDFQATMTFCCPVELEGVRTRFENGRFRIQVPLQDTVYRYIPEGQALCEFGP